MHFAHEWSLSLPQSSQLLSLSVSGERIAGAAKEGAEVVVEVVAAAAAAEEPTLAVVE